MSNPKQIDPADLARVIGGSSAATKQALTDFVGQMQSVTTQIEQTKKQSMAQASNALVQSVLGSALTPAAVPATGATGRLR